MCIDMILPKERETQSAFARSLNVVQQIGIDIDREALVNDQKLSKNRGTCSATCENPPFSFPRRGTLGSDLARKDWSSDNTR